MSENEPRHANVIILGAGFSACAGLPIQREFSELLLSPEFGTELDLAITEALKTFLREVFAWSDGMPLPELEDIFTWEGLTGSRLYNTITIHRMNCLLGLENSNRHAFWASRRK